MVENEKDNEVEIRCGMSLTKFGECESDGLSYKEWDGNEWPHEWVGLWYMKWIDELWYIRWVSESDQANM